MSRNFGTSYHPNEHYMRGPGPACAQNARNILKSNARPASLFHAPAGDAGPPFVNSDGGVKESPASIPDYNGVKSPALVTAHGLSGKSCPLSRLETGPSEARFVLCHAQFLADIAPPSQTLQNFAASAFSFFALGLAALPFFLGAAIWALFF